MLDKYQDGLHMIIVICKLGGCFTCFNFQLHLVTKTILILHTRYIVYLQRMICSKQLAYD